MNVSWRYGARTVLWQLEERQLPQHGIRAWIRRPAAPAALRVARQGGPGLLPGQVDGKLGGILLVRAGPGNRQVEAAPVAGTAGHGRHRPGARAVAAGQPLDGAGQPRRAHRGGEREPGHPGVPRAGRTTCPRAPWPAEPGGEAKPGPEQPASVPATAAMAASAAIREMCIAAPGQEETSPRDWLGRLSPSRAAGSGNDQRRVAMKFSRAHTGDQPGGHETNGLLFMTGRIAG